MEIFDTSKSLIENLYYLSGILILVSLVYGIFQIIYAKRTLIINSKRDAASLAAKQVEIYMHRVIPLLNKLFHEQLKEKMQSEKMEVGEFNAPYLKKTLGEEKFIDSIKERFKFVSLTLSALNSLEAFSVYFIKEVADEEIAFSSVGVTFVNSVEDLYFEIASCIRDENDKTFQNLIKLYQLWKNRITKEKLEKSKENLSEQLKTMESVSIKPIGTK